MKKASIILLIIALSIFGCKSDERDSSFKTELIDGIQHVYNTGEPIKGKISLEVTEVLRIDPAEIDRGNPPLFQSAVKDDSGNLYLADKRNVRVYKFDALGRPLVQFLNRGEGPGEFPRFSDLQIIDKYAWVIGTWPLKIAQFTLDGHHIDEWMFRTFQNFYLRTLVIDDDRFLTVSYRDRGENRDRTRVSALVNSSEEFLTQYYEDENAGIFRIWTGQQEGPAIASTNPIIAADIHHAYDRNSGVVYACDNREYEIQAKNFDGTPRMVIHRVCKKVPLDDQAKERVLQLIAPRIPREVIQPAKEQLPGALNAIWGMTLLPDGHLAVKRITGLESVEIDLFDREGRLLYTILPSAEIPDLRDVIMFEKTIGVVSEGEEKNIYVEYRVKNLKGILD